MILHPISPFRGHYVILERPWIDNLDAFVQCKFKKMFITLGVTVKQVTLYPLAKSLAKIENILCQDNEYNDG